MRLYYYHNNITLATDFVKERMAPLEALYSGQSANLAVAVTLYSD